MSISRTSGRRSRLSRRALVAVLILAAGHIIWHLPLFFTSDPPPVGPFVLELVAGGVVLAWLMNTTGRILLPIILHGAHNMSQQALLSGFTGADLVNVQWLTATGWTVVALIIIWRTRGTLAPTGTRPITVPIHQRARRVRAHAHAGRVLRDQQPWR